MSMTGQEQERLESWKQIAAYLGKSERTVRRWQQVEGLPVHRHQHQQRGSVWAFRNELDDWLAGRRLSPEPLADAPNRHTLPIWVWIAATAFLTAGGAVWFTRPTQRRFPTMDSVPLTSIPGAAYGPTFSPDGKRVAFHLAPGKNGVPGIYVKTIGSDSTTPLVATKPWDLEFNYAPAWSPDGKFIAYLRRVLPAPHAEGSETWLRLVSPDSGMERSLIRVSNGPLLYGNHMHLSWTPDSQWIVTPMADGSRKGIHRVSLTTGKMEQLTSAPRLDYGSQLSPDGRTLVFLRQEGPPGAAVESVLRQNLTSDGLPTGSPQMLYTGRSQASGLAWLPSGKDLIFCNSTNAFFGPFNSRLFLLPADPGHEPVPLPSLDCSTVAVARTASPSRTSVVYASGGNQKAQIFTARLSALDDKTVFAPSTRFDALPSFSPDGATVAFLSNRTGGPEVWLAQRDGSELRRLTEDAAVWSGPRWSPDGKQLLFGAAREHGSLEHRLFVTAVDGGTPRLAAATPNASNPFWATDGQTIFFWRYTQSLRRELWTSPRNRGKPALLGTYLANFQQQSVAVGDSIYFSGSRWPFELKRLSVRDGKEETLTEMSSPYFALTQNFLYFIRKGDRMLCSFPISGGKLKEHGIMPVFEGVRRIIFGMTVSPDDSTILWAVTGEQQLDLQMVPDFR